MDNVMDFEQEKNHANEIIYFNDGRMAPKNDSQLYNIIKKVFIVCIITMLILSLLFGEALFSEISISAWVCVFIIVGYLIKNGGHERVECPAQLHFYEEYLVFCVPKYHYGNGKERMEIQKIYYKDVTKCEFRTNTRKMVICGMMDETHYKYNKQGILDNIPSYQKHYDGMIKFYTVFDYEHDFKKIIEDNSPLKVIYQNA